MRMKGSTDSQMRRDGSWVGTEGREEACGFSKEIALDTQG